ncbi:class I SAM-dependent methyltransferase [Euzebya tangerina]|uniref:class I SAM-dependent methyltransferase n=1 Tax=Euzebya tangerina TaxID=591198 RepID=UPI000E30B7C9|nr:methyltransferase domain-containing protein [Euzebya tangerina]
MTSAAERWTRELAAWEIPPAILQAAPRNPYEFPLAQIASPSGDALASPTGQAVLDVLRPGETLLDVGCGAGRNTGAFTEQFRVVGIEPRPALAQLASERGIDVHGGRWPEVAETVDDAPVVVSHHVMYDVQAPVPFLQAMHRRATRRVVIEVTDRHPWVSVGPLYQAVHGIDRPTGPSADLLAGVVEEAVGAVPEQVTWKRTGSTYDDVEAFLDHQRRMLCIDQAHPQATALREAALASVEVTDDGAVQLPDVHQTSLWWDV